MELLKQNIKKSIINFSIFLNRISKNIINLYIYKIWPFESYIYINIDTIICTNGHYGLLWGVYAFLLTLYFMDYCTQIFYGLLHKYILWIIAQIYYAILKTEYQKIIINLYIYKKCLFESYI